jgi:hypothetical protein
MSNKRNRFAWLHKAYPVQQGGIFIPEKNN